MSYTSGKAFTLIELLIVIAIILILIAIALPNFLEAQLRAKVARAAGAMNSAETAAMAHLTEWNFLYSDFNASSTAFFRTRMKSNFGICSDKIGQITGSQDGGLTFTASRTNFYANNIHCPLTTPIKYIEALDLIDPFSDGTVPMGYDSFEDEDFGKFPRDTVAYAGYFSAGPDHVAGNWLTARMPYSPTNGTKSVGEMWRIIEFLPDTATNPLKNGGFPPYPTLRTH